MPTLGDRIRIAFGSLDIKLCVHFDIVKRSDAVKRVTQSNDDIDIFRYCLTKGRYMWIKQYANRMGLWLQFWWHQPNKTDAKFNKRFHSNLYNSLCHVLNVECIWWNVLVCRQFPTRVQFGSAHVQVIGYSREWMASWTSLWQHHYTSKGNCERHITGNFKDINWEGSTKAKYCCMAFKVKIYQIWSTWNTYCQKIQNMSNSNNNKKKKHATHVLFVNKKTLWEATRAIPKLKETMFQYILIKIYLKSYNFT